MRSEPGFDRERKRPLLAQRRESGERNEIAIEVAILAAARHPDIAGPQPIAKLGQRAEFIGRAINDAVVDHEGPPARRHKAQRHLVGQASFAVVVKIGDDGERVEDALDRSGTAKRERPQELPGEQSHRAMSLDQFGRAVDRLGADEDFRLSDSGTEPFPIERADTRKGVDTLCVRVDQHAAAIGQST